MSNDMYTDLDKDLGQILINQPVRITQYNLGPVLRKMRHMHPDPLTHLASDCASTPDAIRNMERADGTHYVSLPLLFRFINMLGLELKLQKKKSPDE